MTISDGLLTVFVGFFLTGAAGFVTWLLRTILDTEKWKAANSQVLITLQEQHSELADDVTRIKERIGFGYAPR